ncbi:SurA N-terminal domain-containing protein [Anoxynatronum buryatiense]|uniref:SurA N-terminal domain-containing protein n=1 Tax=Anoxynatronum buryatiense TaxID=489973 RepID=A0AA45WT92_9CLOT|nr:SurA N-terminal domain-containing protein [Anoxynatronum buryatiense]SMP40809.1 SurA N-terminal domain-containing protein [Anoxynatronum buryatiense]
MHMNMKSQKNKKTGIRKIAGLLVLMLMITLLAACGGSEEPEEVAEVELGEPVAMVNGNAIYQGSFDRTTDRMIWSYEQQGMDFSGEEGDELRLQVEESVLEHLIQQAVMLQEAEKLSLKVDDEAVENEFENLKSQFDTEEAFKDILERTMFTERELKETLKIEMTIEALLQHAVGDMEVEEAELQEMYSFYEMQYEMQMEAMEESGQELSPEELAMMELPPYDEMKETLRNQLLQEKQQEAMMVYVDELMESSDIEKFM